MNSCHARGVYDPSMRVLTVLELLQARERVSGPELARRLEVSPRTVQRYVARLQDLGVPVLSTRGVGGAYRLAPGFRLPPLMFSDDEALALALGLRALRHLGLTSVAPAAEGASAKLERVLPQPVSARVRDVAGAVQLAASPWTVETDSHTVALLAGAVRARQAVAFDYRARAGEPSRREAEPYGLVHLDGRWYLVGRCRARAALRSFRLDRLSAPRTLDSPFTPPEGFDARAYLQASMPFAQARYGIEVWLGLPLAQASWRLQSDRVQLTAEGEGTCLRCSREELEPFAALLLGLGCSLRVRAPDELRGALRHLAERALQAAQKE